MARATRVHGPFRADSSDRVSVSATTQDKLAIVRKIALSADGVYAVGSVPDCDIVRMWLNTETAWEASAGCTTTLNVGISADVDLYGTVVVSGVGTRDVPLSAACIGITSADVIIVNVTTVGTAGVGVGHFYIQYIQDVE